MHRSDLMHAELILLRELHLTLSTHRCHNNKLPPRFSDLLIPVSNWQKTCDKRCCHLIFWTTESEDWNWQILFHCSSLPYMMDWYCKSSSWDHKQYITMFSMQNNFLRDWFCLPSSYLASICWIHIGYQFSPRICSILHRPWTWMNNIWIWDKIGFKYAGSIFKWL